MPTAAEILDAPSAAAILDTSTATSSEEEKKKSVIDTILGPAPAPEPAGVPWWKQLAQAGVSAGTAIERGVGDTLKTAGYVTELPSQLLLEQTPEQAKAGLESNPLYAAGKSVEKFSHTDEYVDPSLKGGAAEAIGGATGGVLDMVTESMLGEGWLKAAGLAPKAAKLLSVAGVFGSKGGARGVDVAEEINAPQDKVLESFLTDAAIGAGTSVISPAGKWIERLNTATGGGFITAAKRALLEGGQNALQMFGMTLGDAYADKAILNKDHDLQKELTESVKQGGATGAVASLVVSALSGRFRPAVAPRTATEIIDQPEALADKTAVSAVNEPTPTVDAIRQEIPSASDLSNRQVATEPASISSTLETPSKSIPQPEITSPAVESQAATAASLTGEPFGFGPGAASAGEPLASYEKRRFAERLQKDKALADDLRENIGNRYYEPIPNKITAEEAARLVDERGPSQTIAAITDPKSDLPFHVRSTMGQIALKRLNESFQRLRNVDPVAADEVLNRSVETAEWLEEFGTTLGQGVQSFAMWSRLTPEGQLLKFQRAVRKARDSHAAEHGDEVKQIIGDISKPNQTRTQQEIAFRRLTKSNGVAKQIKSQEAQLIDAARQGLLNDKTFYDITAERLGLPKFTPEIASKIVDFASKIDNAHEGMPKQEAQLALAKFIASQTGFAPKDLPIGIYYGNILSGYNTQLVNTVDTFLNIVSEVNGLAVANPRAAAKIYAGALRGFLDGKADFLLALTRGRMVTDGKWLEVPKLMEAARFGEKGGVPIRTDTRSGRILKAIAESKPGKILNAWKYVTRLMAASDALMFRSAKEARMSLLADRAAREKGLSGEALDRYVEESLGLSEAQSAQYDEQARQEGFDGVAARARRAELRELERNPEARADAADFAGVATYNHEPTGVLGYMAKGLGGFAEKYPLMKIFVPFTRIVANVTNRGLNYTPLGFKRAWNEAAGSDARAQHLARATFGTLGLSLLGSLQASGAINIHGAGPSDNEHRKQLETAGWKPYSIQIGNHFISYLYTPLNLGVSILGNMIDAARYRELDQKDIVTRGVYAMSRIGSTVFSQSFLSGLSGLFRALSGAPGDVISSIKNTLASTVGGLTTPTIVRDVQRIFDPKRYQSDTISGDMLRNTPFASLVNRPALSAFGEPIEFPSSRFTSRLTDDPAWKVVVKMGLRVPVPSKTTEMPDGKGGKRRITPEEYYDYLKMTGPKVKEFILKRGDRWFTLDPELAQTALSEGIKSIREQALVKLRSKALRDLRNR